MRRHLQLTDEIRGVLEPEGVVLESAFVVDAEPAALVFVCRVGLPGTRPLAKPRRVVKFSKRDMRYAVPGA